MMKQTRNFFQAGFDCYTKLSSSCSVFLGGVGCGTICSIFSSTQQIHPENLNKDII
jgi:hypothetical protein